MNSSMHDLGGLEGPPIFITGTPKSGKSVLLEVFRQIDNFHVVDEPLSTWKIGTHSNKDDCRTAVDATDEIKQTTRHEILRQCQAAGACRYTDVLSHHALQIPYLRAIFPDARIVVVTRDPQFFLPEALYFWTLKPSILRTLRIRWRNLKLSTLHSMIRRFLGNMASNRSQGRLNTWGAIVPGQEAFAQTHSVIELAAYQWAALYEATLTAAETDKSVFFVSFEKLLHHPSETVEATLRFCQVPVTPAVVDFAVSYFDPDFQYRQKIELTDAEWRSAWQVVCQTATRLGYKAPE